ncbi:DUF2284 domain-containing protein [bacterium]|nr:DUF2284 domain-containing protein [bacterium]MBU2599184.1 DUF2284 domain-containing protein [bacterium]
MLERLVTKALELGVKETKIISPRTIKVASWVRMKCQYGCYGYNQSLTCPPYSPTPEQTKKTLSDYQKAILIHSLKCKIIQEAVRILEKEAYYLGFYKALGMGAGPCELCPKCSLKNACKYPSLARPSMEACGIDVFISVRNNGFLVETLKEEDQEKANYFGLILIT